MVGQQDSRDALGRLSSHLIRLFLRQCRCTLGESSKYTDYDMVEASRQLELVAPGNPSPWRGQK